CRGVVQWSKNLFRHSLAGTRGAEIGAHYPPELVEGHYSLHPEHDCSLNEDHLAVELTPPPAGPSFGFAIRHDQLVEVRGRYLPIVGAIDIPGRPDHGGLNTNNIKEAGGP